MTDVLESTAGYIDSELSDYEDNYKDYKDTNSLNNYYLTNYNNYTNNSTLYHLKNNNNTNYNKFNNTNTNNESLNGNNLYKWSKCVSKHELKSPRFGRDDLNNNLDKLDSNQNKKEFLYNRTSFDTVDSLTPLGNNFEKSFKWWRDDESHSNNSELLNDTTEEEFDNREDFVNDLDNSDTDLSTKNNDELVLSTTDLSLNNNQDNIEWKSWTVGTNELNELKAKLLNKLLNKNSNSKLNNDLLNDTEVQEDQEDGKLNELKYYKEMNKLLLDKLLWLLNNNNYKLEYNLNQQYITSIQNHLVKVHEYINTLTTTDTVTSVTAKVDETKQDGQQLTNTQISDVNAVNDTEVQGDQTKLDKFQEKYPEFDVEHYEKLKSENAELKKQLQELKQGLTTSDTFKFKSDVDVDSNMFDNDKYTSDYNNNSNTSTEDTEKQELLEKLKLVEESKNLLEEDFKKTLVYMRLMKDRLKFFKNFNTQNINSNTPNPNNTTTNLNLNSNQNQSTLSPNVVNHSVNNLSTPQTNNVNYQQNYPTNLHFNKVNNVNNTNNLVNRQLKPNQYQYTSPYTNNPLRSNTASTNNSNTTSNNTSLNKTNNTIGSTLKPVAMNNTSPVTSTTGFGSNTNVTGVTPTVTAGTTGVTRFGGNTPYLGYSPVVTGNVSNKFSPVNNVNNFKKRSNSCVRFKEESELYVVPRSLSETRPTMNNNKFSKFFKLFSKS